MTNFKILVNYSVPKIVCDCLFISEIMFTDFEVNKMYSKTLLKTA